MILPTQQNFRNDISALRIMAPIKVGIIGLSSLTTHVPATAGDGWAARFVLHLR